MHLRPRWPTLGTQMRLLILGTATWGLHVATETLFRAGHATVQERLEPMIVVSVLTAAAVMVFTRANVLAQASIAFLIAVLALAAVLVLGVIALLGLIFYRRGKSQPGWFSGLTLGLALLTVGAMIWTASLGGQIRHPEIHQNAGR